MPIVTINNFGKTNREFRTQKCIKRGTINDMDGLFSACWQIRTKTFY